MKQIHIDSSKKKTTIKPTCEDLCMNELRNEVNALRNEVKHLQDTVRRLNKGEHAE